MDSKNDERETPRPPPMTLTGWILQGLMYLSIAVFAFVFYTAVKYT